MKTLIIISLSLAVTVLADIIFGIVFSIIYRWKYDISSQLELSEDYGFGMLASIGLIAVSITVFVASIFIIGNFLTNRNINKDQQ